MTLGNMLPWKVNKGEPVPEPPEDAVFAKMLHDGVPQIIGDNDGTRFMDPEPPRRRKQDKGPFSFLPRWVLIVGLGGFLVTGGAWLNEKTTAQSRLEAAIADAPGKYTARLAERIADVEAASRERKDQLTQLQAMVERDRIEAKADRKELELLVRQLSVQVVTLTTEVRARR